MTQTCDKIQTVGFATLIHNTTNGEKLHRVPLISKSLHNHKTRTAEMSKKRPERISPFTSGWVIHYYEFRPESVLVTKQ